MTKTNQQRVDEINDTFHKGVTALRGRSLTERAMSRNKCNVEIEKLFFIHDNAIEDIHKELTGNKEEEE